LFKFKCKVNGKNKFTLFGTDGRVSILLGNRKAFEYFGAHFSRPKTKA